MPVAGTVAARADDPTVSHPVIPVSLVLVKLDSAHPVQINLAVPAAVENGNVATRFSLNLRDVVPQALSGEYQLYLCSGVKVLGPQAVTLP